MVFAIFIKCFWENWAKNWVCDEAVPHVCEKKAIQSAMKTEKSFGKFYLKGFVLKWLHCGAEFSWGFRRETKFCKLLNFVLFKQIYPSVFIPLSKYKAKNLTVDFNIDNHLFTLVNYLIQHDFLITPFHIIKSIKYIYSV